MRTGVTEITIDRPHLLLNKAKIPLSKCYDPSAYLIYSLNTSSPEPILPRQPSVDLNIDGESPKKQKLAASNIFKSALHYKTQ